LRPEVGTVVNRLNKRIKRVRAVREDWFA